MLFVTIASAELLSEPGCGSTEGSLGGRCHCADCGAFSGRWYCDDGLVCNAVGTYTCIAPHSIDEGGACGEDDACLLGLFCKALVCEPKGGLHATCGADTMCADGLSCLKLCGMAQCLPTGATSCDADAGADADDATEAGGK